MGGGLPALPGTHAAECIQETAGSTQAAQSIRLLALMAGVEPGCAPDISPLHSDVVLRARSIDSQLVWRLNGVAVVKHGGQAVFSGAGAL